MVSSSLLSLTVRLSTHIVNRKVFLVNSEHCFMFSLFIRSCGFAWLKQIHDFI